VRVLEELVLRRGELEAPGIAGGCRPTPRKVSVASATITAPTVIVA